MAEKYDSECLRSWRHGCGRRAGDSEEKATTDQMRPSLSYWKDAFRRFRRNRLAMAMAILLIVIVLLAIFGPIFSPYTYSGQSADVRQGPSLAHPLGTTGWDATCSSG